MDTVDVQKHHLEFLSLIPIFLKDDIIYCQRALECHKDVYVMMMELYSRLLNVDEEQKKRNIKELEATICELTDEQKSLREHLQLLLVDIYNQLKHTGVSYNLHIISSLLIKELKTHCYDPNYVVNPTNLYRRCTKDELVGKYLTPANGYDEVAEENVPMDLTLSNSKQERHVEYSPPQYLQFRNENYVKEDEENVPIDLTLKNSKQKRQVKSSSPQAFQSGSANFAMQQIPMVEWMQQMAAETSRYTSLLQESDPNLLQMNILRNTFETVKSVYENKSNF